MPSVMYRLLHRLSSLLFVLTCALSCLTAGSRQGHGIITAVSQGKPGHPPTIQIEGKFASHFSGQRFLPWNFSLQLKATGEQTGTYIYIVDGLVVPDHIGKMALAPGRRVAFSEDCIAIETSDEMSELGIITAVDGHSVVLTKVENATPGYGREQGQKDFTFELVENTTFIQDAQPATREQVLQAGTYARIMGAAPQTINVIEPFAPIRSFPGNYAGSAWGTITGYDKEKHVVSALVQNPDGSVKERDFIARKHVSLDGHYLPRTDADRFRWHAAFEVGREALFFCHRGSTDPNEVYIQSVKTGEIKGILKAVTDDALEVAVWRDGAMTPISVPRESTARYRLNYVDTDADAALKVGQWIHIRPSHGMQVVTGRWDQPTTPDTKPAPSVTDLQAEPGAVGEIHLSWTSTFGLGLPTVAYFIYRDGELVGTSSSGTFTEHSLAEATTYSYTVRSVNRWGITSADSAIASGTTVIDTIAPTIIEYRADSEKNTVTFDLSKPIDPNSVSPSNLNLAGATITAVDFAKENQQITFTAESLAYGQSYTGRLTEVHDASQSKNPLGPQAINVTAWPELQITEINSDSGKKYTLATLAVETNVFSDRDYKPSAVHEDLVGLTILQTPLDEKKNAPDSSHTLSFAYNRPIRLHIMASSRSLDATFDGFKRVEDERFKIKAHSGYVSFAKNLLEPGNITLPIPVRAGRRPSMYWLIFEPISP